ncbi:MAG: reverse transcriptase domain-containing protein [Nitrososphaera sp.]|nr:reverse transcriptase domain-containing protein [Nitrososphaera sp.]
MLEAVRSNLPSIYHYVRTSYADKSAVFIGDAIIWAEEGVHQGDPLGPLLLSLTIHPLLQNSSFELALGYLDDVTLAGPLMTLANELDLISVSASRMGLQLNTSKSEIICEVSCAG